MLGYEKVLSISSPSIVDLISKYSRVDLLLFIGICSVFVIGGFVCVYFYVNRLENEIYRTRGMMKMISNEVINNNPLVRFAFRDNNLLKYIK